MLQNFIKNKILHYYILLFSFTMLSACSSFQPESGLGGKNKEYFAESKYHAKASPRVNYSKAELKKHHGSYLKQGKPYKIHGKWYYPQKKLTHFTQTGKASWYGSAFQGRLTANGEVYDMNALSAAHPTLPLPCYVRVVNLDNLASVIVRVNDRGPYISNRIIDLSKKAAELLHYKNTGVARVKIQYIGSAPLMGDDARYLIASYRPPKKSVGNKGAVMVASYKESNNFTKSKNRLKMVALNEPSLPNVGPILSFKE